MNVATPTTSPSTIWPRTHEPNTRRTMPRTAQVSARQAVGTARSKARTIIGRSFRIQKAQTGMMR